jgi:NADPH:quinone reductase-like Zn-dependent oxidoreductase
VQFARRHGARVITTASARNREFLMQLGAEQVIDYHSERFEDRAMGVDVILDTVGGETLRRSWDLLSQKGRLVTIAADSEGTKDERTKNAFFIVETRRDQLSMIAKLLDTGEIRAFVDAEVPFELVGDAYAGKVKDRLGRGKVVLVIGE